MEVSKLVEIMTREQSHLVIIFVKPHITTVTF